MAERKKISELDELTTLTGGESAPVVYDGGNFRVTLSTLKEYFRDSSLVPFDAVDNTDAEVVQGSSGEEEGVEYAIVYLSKKSVFARRRRKTGTADSYFSEFTRKDDFMIDSAVRTDKVFFCLADKELYVQDGFLRNIFDTVRINAMTEEELENLEHPIEGAFYATYE